MSKFSRKIIIFAGIYSAGLAFSACSRKPSDAPVQEAAPIQAVEVGNPKDSQPAKPSQPVPLQLVEVEVKASNFTNITRMKLALTGVEFFNLRNPSERYALKFDMPNAPQSTLLLGPETTTSYGLQVPESLVALENGFVFVLKIDQQTESSVTLLGGDFPQFFRFDKDVHLFAQKSSAPGGKAPGFAALVNEPVLSSQSSSLSKLIRATSSGPSY